jgi:subtilisin family serine protease
MSGTSVAAAVVSGVVALMLQANPALAPAEVAAILRSTARPAAGADALAQGAGVVDAAAAVTRARALAHAPAEARPAW